ncbi:hypothetical protein D3C72_2205130 [compost metagenome]
MMRLASVMFTSGRVVGMKSRLPSSSGGMNSLPMLLASGTLRTMLATASPTIVFLKRRAVKSTGL